MSQQGEPEAIELQYSQTPVQEHGHFSFEYKETMGALARLRKRADVFRSYVSKTFCSCVEAVPSVALVLITVVLVMLLVAIIPLAFALTYVHPEEQKAPIDFRPVPQLRSFNATWPYDASESIVHSSTLISKNITNCRGYGFACTSRPSVIIGTNQRCDGKTDCEDGSDEIDCGECHTAFSCPVRDGQTSRKLCLRGHSLCDGRPQCFDGSDETFCKSECSSDEHKCKARDKCIPNTMKCDGDDHCPLGDDEEECDECQNGAKMCAPKKTCIPQWKLCDGLVDCPDASDETDCDCRGCSGSDRALCKPDSGRCILRKNLCDGHVDCPSGEDEECSGKCVPEEVGMIECGDRKYHWKYACNGLMSDCVCEKCNTESAFQCADEMRCIHRRKVCNGVPDCSDGSDENNCGCSGPTSISCGDELRCIDKSLRCDGFADCPDGNDEHGCAECHGADTLLCVADQRCLPSAKRCDGVEDCSDGSDEAHCTKEECAVHPKDMYMCESAAGRCFPRNELCTPYTRCPNPTKRDKLVCAVVHTKRPFF